MSKLQKKPAAHKRGHPTLQNMNFFYFGGSFLPSWIRIRIPNTDPDPLARLNTDPIRIRIRNPGCGAGAVIRNYGSGSRHFNYGGFGSGLRSISINVYDRQGLRIRIRIIL